MNLPIDFTISKLRFTLLILCTVCTLSGSSYAQNPKREFRGAWIQCVNGQFNGMGTVQMQQTLLYQLDQLQHAGINAILFQVRPEADALYESSYEPWSRFLTGTQGKAPVPYWDPLQWMVEQCHARGMELHAWINPYRAKTKSTTQLSPIHPYNRNPERFFEYDGLLIFDPGIPENRAYICHIAADIVSRYDVDGLHIDDYFYPYPSPGIEIPDQNTFQYYGAGFKNKNDWRRHNVNMLVRDLCHTIHRVKPWVKFGVSPFGIYRNKRNSPIGSDTNGLQNYDDLYADVLTWIRNGWIDYNIPQVYWEIGHKTADYETLLRWWSKHAQGRPLIIGQDVERTVAHADLNNPTTHQLHAKMHLQRTLPGIEGSCQWYAKAVVDNVGNYGTALREHYHRYPALQPAMPFLDDNAPKKVRRIKDVWTKDGLVLFWKAPKEKKPLNIAKRYVVYRFKKGEPQNLDNPAHIVGITPNTFLKLPYENGKTHYYYVVTALDRVSNESKGVRRKVKL